MAHDHDPTGCDGCMDVWTAGRADGARAERLDPDYTAKIVEVLTDAVTPGTAVGVFERIDCAVCTSCRKVLMMLPDGVPAPAAALFEHDCDRESDDV